MERYGMIADEGFAVMAPMSERGWWCYRMWQNKSRMEWQGSLPRSTSEAAERVDEIILSMSMQQ